MRDSKRVALRGRLTSPQIDFSDECSRSLLVTTTDPITRMKRYHFSFIVLLLSSLLAGCSYSPGGPSLIVDYMSASIRIGVVDAQGASLLNPTTEGGARLLEQCWLEIDGKRLPYSGQGVRTDLRAIPEMYRMLSLVNTDAGYMLEIGEFQPNYRKPLKMVLHLPGNQSVPIEYKRFVVDEMKTRTELKVGNRDWAVSEGVVTYTQVVASRKNWEYLEHLDRPASVFLHIFVPEVDSQGRRLWDFDFRDKSFEAHSALHETAILWRDRQYSFGNEDSEPRVSGVGSQQIKGYALAFGPFDPREGYKEEVLKLIINDHQYPFIFSCYVEAESGKVVASLQREGDPSPKNWYFRNGPAQVLSFD